MQVKKGENRIVLVVGCVVVKTARIRIVKAWKHVCQCLQEGDIELLKLGLFKWPVGSIFQTPKRYLFKGIVNNWREFRFYGKTRHPFLQPTCFSVFGLLNIQRAGKVCILKPHDLWCQLYEITGGATIKDIHHFGNPDNFCFQNGNLNILDYGGLKTQEIIKEHGEKIIEQFDPTYSWEERNV